MINGTTKQESEATSAMRQRIIQAINDSIATKESFGELHTRLWTLRNAIWDEVKDIPTSTGRVHSRSTANGRFSNSLRSVLGDLNLKTQKVEAIMSAFRAFCDSIRKIKTPPAKRF